MRLDNTIIRGGSRKAGGPPLYFWRSQFYFLHCIQCLKNIFEIEFGFYTGRNPRIFWRCGGGVCVCVWIEIVAATVFVLQRTHFEWYPRLFWSPKYMPDCRKSHLIFQNFLGSSTRPTAGARAFGARFGASPPYWAPPFQNSWIRPW